MISKFLFGVFLTFLSFQVHAFYELSFDFSYDKQVYGAEKQNKITSRTYSSSLASYFLTYTALEFNYSQSEETTTENTDIALGGTDVTVESLQNVVNTSTYGVGLRQAFTGKGAIFRPTLSLGYAKQVIRASTEYVYRDDSTGESFIISDKPDKDENDSFFATFSLSYKLIKGLSLKGSVQTVMPSFDFDQAGDNMKYLAGLSWLF